MEKKITRFKLFEIFFQLTISRTFFLLLFDLYNYKIHQFLAYHFIFLIKLYKNPAPFYAPNIILIFHINLFLILPITHFFIFPYFSQHQCLCPNYFE